MTERSPTLGELLVEQLRGTEAREVEATVDGVRAHARVAGAGPYGCELEGLTVEREARDAAGRGDRAIAVTEAIARRVDYLAEPLQPLELDRASGRGQLRTRRDRVRGHEYYEIDVDGGDRVDVARYRYDREAGARRPVTDNQGHGVIRRLVDDLNEAMDRRAAPRAEE